MNVSSPLAAALVPRAFARRTLGALAVVTLGLRALSSLLGCAQSEASPSARGDQLVVFAAASLRDAFTALGSEFERSQPGVRVTFNFAGTQELRTQIEHGAPADVFASADERHMDELVRIERATAPVLFARNEAVVAVPSDGATTVRSFGELPNAARIVIGTAEVPIGRYSLEILEKARATSGADFRERVEARVVSRELNARQVLAKVSLGEADAAIVYRTDARAAGDRVTVVPIPPELNAVAHYPIAVVTGAAHPGLAQKWVDFVLSTAGQRALTRAGFVTPGAPSHP